MGLTKKNPNYEADSQTFAEEEKRAQEFEFREASKVVQLNLKRSAEKAASFIDCPPLTEAEYRGAQLSWKASMGFLEMGGIKTLKIEHGGKVQFEPIKIFQEAQSE